MAPKPLSTEHRSAGGAFPGAKITYRAILATFPTWRSSSGAATSLMLRGSASRAVYAYMFGSKLLRQAGGKVIPGSSASCSMPVQCTSAMQRDYIQYTSAKCSPTSGTSGRQTPQQRQGITTSSLAPHPVEHLVRHLHLPQPHKALQQRGQALRCKEQQWQQSRGVYEAAGQTGETAAAWSGSVRAGRGHRRAEHGRLKQHMLHQVYDAASTASCVQSCAAHVQRTWGDGSTPMRAIRAST